MSPLCCTDDQLLFLRYTAVAAIPAAASNTSIMPVCAAAAVSAASGVVTLPSLTGYSPSMAACISAASSSTFSCVISSSFIACVSLLIIRFTGTTLSNVYARRSRLFT